MSDRHRQVKDLFLRARDVPPAVRATWLQEACGGDAVLRGEVESLLTAEEGMPLEFLQPMVELERSSGSTISHYRLIEHLGGGGMGEVWLAHDETLDRRVALKFPTVDLSRNLSIRHRLLREARAAAALEHPAVCRVFELGESAGHAFIAMEYVEGETMAVRLARGPVPLAQALSWGTAIAAALEAAHDKAIVHGDLKPANIMVTASGQIKVMDFGLARVLPDRMGQDAQDRSSGLTVGLIAGTPAYMAPEQVRGEAVDKRADVWAFGCVLYELLTGTRPFNDSRPNGLTDAILHTEPAPLSKHQPLAPRSLERVLRKCLAKDPRARWQSAQDLGDELQWVAEDIAQAASELAAASTSRDRTRQAIRASILAPAEVTGLGVPVLSPDGRSLVFEGWGAGPGHLWVHALTGSAARKLPGTEFGTLPFFSPDGRSLGFFADGSLKVLDLASGRIVTVADGCGLFSAGTWAGDYPGVILFSPGVESGLRRVGGAGGSVAEATSLDGARADFAHLWPQLLPDSRHFLFVVAAGQEPGIYLGSLDHGTIRRLVETPHIAATAVAYSPSGHLLYVREGTLVAQPFDVTRLQLSGEPVRLAEGVSTYGPGVPAFALSAEGTLVFREDAGWPVWQPVWLDRTGRELGAVGPPGPYWSGSSLFRGSRSPDVFRPSISSDGRWLAMTRREANRHPQIWILDLQRATASPFTVSAFNGMPIWSPDGDWLLWGRAADSDPDVYMQSIADSGGGERLIREGPYVQRWPTDWSRSGRFVLVDQESAGPTGWDLFVLDLQAEGRPYRPYLATTAMERTGVFSPDERWIAYSSNVSGVMEIYLSTFPEHGRRWQVSRGGGMLPLWAPDGRELYYVDPEQRVMAVRLHEDAADLTLSEPELLFHHESSGYLAVSPDGTRFLGLRKLEQGSIKPFTLVLDWPRIL
jgi:eukaryotic-like serine/threonine-protein kinase